MYYKKTRNQVSTDSIIIFKALLINLIYALYHLTGYELFNYFGILVLSLCIIYESPEEDFYLFFSLGCFYKLITIFSKSIFFVFEFVSIIKVLKKNNYSLSIFGLFVIICLVLIDVIFDFPAVTIGSFICTIFHFLYGAVILSTSFGKDIRPITLLKICYVTSLLLLVYIVLNSSINGVSLLEYANSEYSYNRLGNETSDILGAMSIPTYAGFVITSAFILFTKSNCKLIEKIIYILGFTYAIITGLLSVSRTFVLVISVFLIFMIFSILLERKKKNGIIFLAIIVIIAIVGINVFNEQIIIAVEKILERFSIHSSIDSSGRTEIWLDCFKYLEANPLNLLFGSGNNNYLIVGNTNDYLFKMSSHSLYLDAIMAWGILGTTLFVLLLIRWCRIIKNRKGQFVFWIPFLVYMSARFLGGSFVYFDSYIYLIAILIIGLKGYNNKVNIS